MGAEQTQMCLNSCLLKGLLSHTLMDGCARLLCACVEVDAHYSRGDVWTMSGRYKYFRISQLWCVFTRNSGAWKEKSGRRFKHLSFSSGANQEKCYFSTRYWMRMKNWFISSETGSICLETEWYFFIHRKHTLRTQLLAHKQTYIH